jgi:glycosyltransferase involved in cell wall biosynthesis
MPVAYSSLDLLCSTSLGEGFSNTIAEAMACGVPVVATDVGDARQIVGDTGVIVPPQRPDLLCAACLETLDRDLAAQRNAARERIVTNFSIAAMVDATRSSLATVCTNPKRRWSAAAVSEATP